MGLKYICPDHFRQASAYLSCSPHLDHCNRFYDGWS